jgi:hypothetical protein
MAVTIEGWIFYLLLIDSIGCNIIAWFYAGWYKKNTKWWAKHFPATKGWCAYYLVLVLWVGYLLYRNGSLGFG